MSGAIHRREFLAVLGAVSARAAASPTVGFAIGTYGMKPVPTLTALREIAGIGYDGVALALMPGWPCDPAQLSTGECRRIRDALRQHQLALPSVNESLPLTGTPEKRAYNQERLKYAAGFVHAVSPEQPACLDTILGLQPAQWESVKDRMVDELHAWARLAEAEQFTIGIKPHAGHALDTPEKALWMLQQVGSARIRLIYDYSHMRVGGFGLAESLRALLPQTAFISLKDSTGGPDQFRFLLPTEGDTDYVTYFRLLKQLRYPGYVSVEVSSMLQRLPGYDPLAAARSCYQRLAPAFAAAQLERPLRLRR